MADADATALAAALAEARSKLPHDWKLTVDPKTKAMVSDVIRRPTEAFVAAVPALSAEGLMLWLGSGGTSDAELVFANAALGKVDALGPDGAAHWAIELARGGRADTVALAALAGVTVPNGSIIEIAEGLRLCAPDTVPQHRLRPLQTRGVNPLHSMAAGIEPTAFLELDVPGCQVLRTDLPLGALPSDKLVDVAHLLALIGPSSPMVLLIWTNFADEVLELSQSGWSAGSPGLELLPAQRGQVVDISAEASSIVTGALSCDDRLQRRLMMAGERLAFAVRRRRPRDKAVEAAIALEALLSGRDQTELSYRYSLRPALLLRTGEGERVALRADLKALYNLRSKVVHGSFVEEGADKQEMVGRCISYCAELGRRIATLGREPNWEQIEVGGQP